MATISIYRRSMPVRVCGTRSARGAMSDANSYVQTAIYHGSSGQAVRLGKVGYDLYARHLIASGRTGWSPDQAICNGTCTFSFWVYRPDTTSSMFVYLTQDLTASTEFGLFFNNNGLKYSKYSSGRYTWFNASPPWPVGSWQKFTMVVNLDAKTYSAYAGPNNDSVICTNAAYSPSLSYIDFLDFSPQANGACYIDDVNIASGCRRWYLLPINPKTPIC